jgi:hypothetical protein
MTVETGKWGMVSYANVSDISKDPLLAPSPVPVNTPISGLSFVLFRMNVADSSTFSR